MSQACCFVSALDERNVVVATTGAIVINTKEL